MSRDLTRARVAAASSALERQIFALKALPAAVDRGPIADPLSEGLRALAEWADLEPTDARFLEVLDVALARITAARGPLGALTADAEARRIDANVAAIADLLRDARRRAIEVVVLAQDRALRAGAAPVAGPKEFHASVGTPSLHVLPMPSPGLLVVLDPAEDPTLDDDPEREAPPAPKPPPGPPASSPEDSHYAALARDGFEDLGMLGNIRRIAEDAPWGDGRISEQRLLDTLDAIAALGWPDERARVLERLFAYRREAAYTDWGRAFGFAFTLACTAGEAAITAAVLGLRQAPSAELSAYASAFALGSNPAIRGAMHALCADPNAELLLVALYVLLRRGEVDVASAAPLLAHPDTRVGAAAARALGAATDAERAIELIDDALRSDPGGEVAVAAAESLLRHDIASGLALVREQLRDELEDPGLLAPNVKHRAIEVLSVAGAAADLELLIQAAAGDWARLAILGWLGHPGALDAMVTALDALSPADVEPRRRLARGIHRIAGAGPAASPCTDAPAWRVWLAEKKLPRGPRLRYGAPFTVAASLDELDDLQTPAGDRRLLGFELALVFGNEFRIDTEGWIARQRAEISFLRERLGAGVEHSAGEWPSHRLGRRRARNG